MCIRDSYRRKYVRTEGKGKTTTITLADGKLPCIATRGYQRHTSGPHDVPLLVDRLAVEAGLLLWFLWKLVYCCGSSTAVVSAVTPVEDEETAGAARCILTVRVVGA